MATKNESEDGMILLCDEWTNDQRMNALFAPLRSRELNPEAWNGKVKFWSELISKWSRSSRTLSFDVSKLKTVFVRDGKHPYCLEEVIQHTTQEGTTVSLQSFLNSQRSPHQSWGAWMISKGASAVKTVGSKVLGVAPGELLVPDIAQDFAVQLHESLQSSHLEPVVPGFKILYLTQDQVDYSINEFTADPRSREILLQILLEQRKLVEFELDRRKFYKVAGTGKPSASIDDVDKGIVRLKVSLDHLQTEIFAVEAKLEDEKASVKNSMKMGNRTKAKMQLKRQKRFEKQLDSVMSQQLNLEHIFDELLNAETNKKLLLAYDTGLSAMKKMVGTGTAEEAAATMEELATLLEINAEISDTFLQDDTEVEDLEKELEKLGEDGDINFEAKNESWKDENPSGDKLVDYDKVLENLEALTTAGLEPVLGIKDNVRVAEPSS